MGGDDIGRADPYPPSQRVPCVFTVGETIGQAQERPAITDQAVVFRKRPDTPGNLESTGSERIAEEQRRVKLNV